MIRQLTSSELPALLELYTHLHAADDPLPDRTAVEGVWDAMQADERLMVFGVFVDGGLVSTCTLTVIPNLTRGCRPYGVIENVATHSDHRRRGHGRAVLFHALSHAWSKGCYKVMLLTGRKDDRTCRFYESAGFDRHAKEAFLARPPS